MSTTGRKPVAAAPAAVPAMMPSASGVLRTRSAPNSFTRSARLVATPSPNMMTFGSRRISSASAWPIASLTVIVAMLFPYLCVDIGGEFDRFRERRGLGKGHRGVDRDGGALAHRVELCGRQGALRLQ